MLTPEELQEVWTLLQVSPQLEARSYLKKKEGLQKSVAEVTEMIEAHTWKWWGRWQDWDFEKFPIFCHDCGYPVKCHPVFRGNTMVQIKCQICPLVMWQQAQQSV